MKDLLTPRAQARYEHLLRNLQARILLYDEKDQGEPEYEEHETSGIRQNTPQHNRPRRNKILKV